MGDWKEKFGKLTQKTHSEQTIWFLNGFWEDGMKERAEEFWGIANHFIESQIGEPILYGSKRQVIKEDADLDEFKSHQILEKMGETLTVMELRKRLQKLDLDNNKRMAVSEYLLDKFSKRPEDLVDAPQGDVDPDKLAAAQEACEKAGDSLSQASSDAAAAATALSNSTVAAAEAATLKTEADEALAKAEAAEAVVKAAEAELQAAIDEITAIETKQAADIAKFQKLIDDPATSTVKRGGAVQQKEALLAADPLPLRKAKITQGAALKKVTKARVAAEEVTKASDQAAKAAAAAKIAADEAAVAAEEAKKVADEAAVAAEKALAEAQEALNELKSKGSGSPQGKLWWMERILQEKAKFSRR